MPKTNKKIQSIRQKCQTAKLLFWSLGNHTWDNW